MLVVKMAMAQRLLLLALLCCAQVLDHQMTEQDLHAVLLEVLQALPPGKQHSKVSGVAHVHCTAEMAQTSVGVRWWRWVHPAPDIGVVTGDGLRQGTGCSSSPI